MKKIKMFVIGYCPHCKAAISWMEELFEQDAEYKSLEVEIIDEELHADRANRYDYYYVPTYYIDEVKVHEGVASLELVKSVFDSALGR